MKQLLALKFGVFAALALWAASALAQGVLIVHHPPYPVPLPRPIIWPPPHPHPYPPPRPLPPMSYKIKELGVYARVTDQVARVQVSQSFVNTGSRQMEVSFVFPLPYDGAVDRLTFLVDGKEYAGQILPAKKARSIYEDFIRKSKDPALLEWLGSGMFKTSVFPVPPGAERKVTLRYNQLLQKDRNLTNLLFPLSTAKYTSKPVEKVRIEVAIESTAKIKSVYSPTYPIEIKRPDDNHATVTYESKNEIPAADFRLFYDVAPGKLGASVLSYRPDGDKEGYLLLLASPEIKAKGAERPKKTVVFVVDRSGSMSGKKIEQVRDALKFVLNNLREGDLFNIVAYDSGIETFRPELERYNDKTRGEALGFAEGLHAGGATNIDGALARAMGMLKDDSRPSFILFLTDGLPTAGETAEMKIVANAKKNNRVRARMVNFGVGYDVNTRLLDRLSRANFGKSEYVRPNEDIEAHVSRLYDKISSPVMTDVAVDFEFDSVKVEQGKPVSRIYPKEVNDLFEGEQLVLVGRYNKPGAVKVKITGKVAGKEQKLDFAAELTGRSADDSYAFVEKIWAMRRIGDIIDELDLKGRNDELVKELVALSTEHGILTPYTSFLADDQGKASDLADARRGGGVSFNRARASLGRLTEAAGRAGFAQRALKKQLQEATRAAPAPSRPAADGVGGAAGPGSYGGVPALRDIESDEDVAVESVRTAGKNTIYKRGDVWIAASAAEVDPEKDKAKIRVIERFTDEYFKLVAANTPAENRVLALQRPGEELIIKLRGQVYRLK